jgi:hypothetical protein
MKQVAPKLFVGSEADFAELDQFGTEWAIVHAARDPYHRKLLGYTGRGAPSDHPEYLFAQRGKRLYLNLIDGPDPKYVNATMIDKAMAFIDAQLAELADKPESLFLGCNQGNSRAPTLAMLYLAPSLPEDFDEALVRFKGLYPDHAPAEGIKGFARIHWRRYRNRKGTGAPQVADDTDWAVDKAQEVWQAFCETLKSDPTDARDRLIHAISSALRDAANGKAPTLDS